MVPEIYGCGTDYSDLSRFHREQGTGAWGNEACIVVDDQ